MVLQVHAIENVILMYNMRTLIWWISEESHGWTGPVSIFPESALDSFKLAIKPHLFRGLNSRWDSVSHILALGLCLRSWLLYGSLQSLFIGPSWARCPLPRRGPSWRCGQCWGCGCGGQISQCPLIRTSYVPSSLCLIFSRSLRHTPHHNPGILRSRSLLASHHYSTCPWYHCLSECII